MTVDIYRFSKDTYLSGPAHGPALLGGKGAGLQAMCKLGLNVPPGFTIPTSVCNALYKTKGGDAVEMLNNIMVDSMVHMAWLKDKFGYMPLVSVRSGAPISMPGMMDTILNVGLTTENLEEWGKRIGDKAALDSYRRLIQMLGGTAFNIDGAKFEFQLASVKKTAKVETDSDLSKKNLQDVIKRYKVVFKENAGIDFPDNLEQQLGFAIKAVFDSWMSERAIEYRKINKIDEAMGTACTVQAMVFGNMGDDSGSGVLFTRDPSTGEDIVMGEYLKNAQGEDVVAGIRTPEKVGGYLACTPWGSELLDVVDKLEDHYKDMVDIEFTVQKGELFVLQSRKGKRSAPAAFKIAVDLANDGVIPIGEVFERITTDQFNTVRKPVIDPKFKEEPMVTGLPASPGVAVGVPVFSSKAAVDSKEPCILITHETTPDDIAGMNKAVGILTQTGGATSHAAVVARAMDKPCVVGATKLLLDSINNGSVKKVTLDGSTGRVWYNIDVPVIDNSANTAVKTVLDWCLEKAEFIPKYALDPDEEVPGPYMVSSEAWWGDEDALDVVLDNIASKSNKSSIILDAREPKNLVPKDDYPLLFIFEGESDDDFIQTVTQRLTKKGESLKGLTVLFSDGQPGPLYLDMFKKYGINVPAPPQTVADLMLPMSSAPSQNFIDKIIGGQDAWIKLSLLLSQAGFKPKAVAMSAPAEYAAFKVLAKIG